MAFVVLYDASVLYPIRLCDLLVRVAQTGLVQAKWTRQILDEATEAGIRSKPEAEEYLRERSYRLMEALRDGEVTGYEQLIDGLTLPDADDRHVLAAAIRCHAQVIVTNNLRDFPSDALEPYFIEAQSADEFMCHLVDLNPALVLKAIKHMARIAKRPQQSTEELLAQFANRYELPEMAAYLAEELTAADPL